MKHKKIRPRRFSRVGAALFLLFLCGFFATAAQAEVVLIANSSVEKDRLSSAAVKKIFTGKTVTWDNGQQIKPVLLDDKDLHAQFVKNYVSKTPVQFRNYWQMMIFTGKGIKPRSLDSEQAVIDFVTETQGAIGYVSAASVQSNLKVLAVSE